MNHYQKKELISRGTFYKVIKTLIILIVLAQVSCGFSRGEDKASFRLELYLKNEFNMTLVADKKYVFFYLDGCSGCMDSYREFITNHSNKNDISVFLLSQSDKKARSVFDPLTDLNVYIDTSIAALFTYELIVANPKVFVNSKSGLEEIELQIQDVMTIFL